MAKPTEPPKRCAIYTRKSTEEGLEQDFNSLDAQRESGEAYVKSQGWASLPDRYDDGGFSGGNTERPALKRLMADIEAGRIDCVVVYKVDRLSRSLMDFSRLMETFERVGVSFVSVTQHFNTTHSMGRLTLNILLSFAQFEREIISERTRDKIAAARRKGKWAGGRPVLGYDIVPGTGGSKLVVNDAEARIVRSIFEMYLASDRGLIPLAAACAERGWVTKAWTTSKGESQGGCPLNKKRLHALLTNPVYLGLVRHKDEVFPGEHEAIVTQSVFDAVQKKLRLNGKTGGSRVRNAHHALLKGILRCGACGRAMTHTFASKTSGKATVRHRYYACSTVLKEGRSACSCPSLPAGEIEGFVVRTMKDALAGDAVIDAVVERALAVLAAERPNLLVDPDEVVGAAESFDPVWDAMTPKEREALVRGLVARVVYDPDASSVSVTFHEGVPSPEDIAEGIAA
ncbi:MAG: recombinase family protein [Planctomycetota bacterium]|nr:MAG: recombinase family protein [Planctomycetota bacterium]